MKVLIVGASSALAQRLLAHEGRFDSVYTAGRSHGDIQLDLLDWQALPDSLPSVDTVVHLAADFGGTNDDDYRRCELVNAVGTLTVCALARATRASHLVVISTVSAAYSIRDSLNNIYGLSKRHAEEVAELYCRDAKINLAVLRVSQIYDEADTCRVHQNLFYMIVDQAARGGTVLLHGNNDAARNYIHIRDVAEIIVRVIEQRVEGRYTCMHPETLKLSELARAAFSVFGNPCRLKFDTDKPDIPDLPAILDTSLYNKIGYAPKIDIRTGLESIRGYREDVL